MQELITRTAFAIVMIAVFLAAYFLYRPMIFILMIAVYFIMSDEYRNMMANLGIKVSHIHSVISAAAVTAVLMPSDIILFYVGSFSDTEIYGGKFILALLYVAGCSFVYRKKFRHQIGLTVWITIPVFLCLLLLFDEASGVYIVMLALIISSGDIFAYLVGKKFGKTKPFPSISPNKSLEGFIASLVFSVIAGLLFNHYYGLFPFLYDLPVFVVINLFAQFGDLVESAIKRRSNVKDSSTLIPGHGGLLDRFDGYLTALPVYVAFMIIGGQFPFRF